MKVSAWWLLFVVVLSLAAAYLFFKYVYTPSETVTVNSRPNNDVMILKLPTSKDPAVFGPKYWEVYHTMTGNIPCSICRDKAVPFMKFFHDVVNQQTGKNIFDKDNFNKHIDLVSNLKKA